MTREELELERLAGCIADDEPVNWHAVDPVAPHDAVAALSGLRELEQLAQGFRRIAASELPRGHLRGTPSFRFGDLDVFERLGAGSQGEVWRAHHALLDQSVALKLRQPESASSAQQFLEEARQLARVRHANIVGVYGAAIHDGRAGLWTELVGGSTLVALLAEHGPLPPEEVRLIGIDLCQALAVVHRHGLVHGDIKPENVMRDHGGRIVLMDFGATRDFVATDETAVSGSPNYLAPEVLEGAAPSPASDIFALGVLLFRLASGHFPYPQRDADTLAPSTAVSAIRLETVVPAFPRDLAATIDRTIAVAPLDRPASVLALAAALAPVAAPIPARGARVSRHGVAMLALAALLACAVSILAWRGMTPLPAWQATANFKRVEGAVAAPLGDGSPLTLGDRLMLEFESNQPAYVYVFNDDGQGEAAVLFPLPGLASGNPLAAHAAYQLPGKSGATNLSWQISSAAAREEFIVLAADSPQPQLEQAISAWQRASAAPPAPARGALQLAPAPNDLAIASATLRQLLQSIDPQQSSHLRRWRFVFPHAPA